MLLYDEGEKLTRKDMNDFEKMLGFLFPQDYVEFILQSNGGTPEEDFIFDFVDASSSEKNSTDIREFYVFYKNNETSYDDIIKINRIMKEEGQISTEYFVFGDDSGGNPICMKISGEDVGKIFFCDHELEDLNSSYLLMSKVANSFSEFLSMLYEQED